MCMTFKCKVKWAYKVPKGAHIIHRRGGHVVADAFNHNIGNWENIEEGVDSLVSDTVGKKRRSE
jgi:hypothetical protein